MCCVLNIEVIVEGVEIIVEFVLLCGMGIGLF